MAEPPSMLAVDPPDHTRFRRLVSRAFTPRATAAFEPVVQRTADALLDALADPTRFDVTRAEAREHVAFSAGIHYCVGAGLARLDGVVGLRALSERFPELRVTAGRCGGICRRCGGSSTCR